MVEKWVTFVVIGGRYPVLTRFSDTQFKSHPVKGGISGQNCFAFQATVKKILHIEQHCLFVALFLGSTTNEDCSLINTSIDPFFDRSLTTVSWFLTSLSLAS